MGGSFNDTKRAVFTGQDLRFTTKGGTLYAIALAWPDKSLTIKSLGASAGKVSGVRLLGHQGRIEWTQHAAGLEIQLPQAAPSQHAVTFAIEGVLR